MPHTFSDSLFFSTLLSKSRAKINIVSAPSHPKLPANGSVLSPLRSTEDPAVARDRLSLAVMEAVCNKARWLISACRLSLPISLLSGATALILLAV